jgi:hypothetical protein
LPHRDPLEHLFVPFERRLDFGIGDSCRPFGVTAMEEEGKRADHQSDE